MFAHMRKGGKLGAGGWMRVMVFGFCVIGAGCFAAAPVQHVRVSQIIVTVHCEDASKFAG